MNLISIIETIVLAIETAESPVRTFRFYAGDKAAQNLEADDEVFPAVYLDTPLRCNMSLKQSGYIEKSYPINIFFFDKSDSEDDTEARHNEIIEEMALAAEQFIQRLSKSADIRYIENLEGEGIKQVFDSNLSGYRLAILITPFDQKSICV